MVGSRACDSRYELCVAFAHMIGYRTLIGRDMLMRSPLLSTSILDHHEINKFVKGLLHESTGNGNACSVLSRVVPALVGHLFIANGRSLHRRVPSLGCGKARRASLAISDSAKLLR